MAIPMQTRGRKAYTDISLNVAAKGLEDAAERSDVTPEEATQIAGIAVVLRALAVQISKRESSYGKKTA